MSVQASKVRIVLRGVKPPARVQSRVGRKRSCTTPTPVCLKALADLEGVQPEVAARLEELLVQVGCPPEAPASGGEKSRAPSRGASSRGPSPAPSNPGRGGSRGRGRGRGAQPAAGGKARGRGVAWPGGRGRKRGFGEVAAEDGGAPAASCACAVCGYAAVGEAALLECSGGAACGKRFHLLCLDPPPEAGIEGWLCPDCDADACAVCGGAGELLLCDDCPRAWHLHCSVPVLDAVPEGDWRCAVCRGELGEEDLMETDATQDTTAPSPAPSATPSDATSAATAAATTTSTSTSTSATISTSASISKPPKPAAPPAAKRELCTRERCNVCGAAGEGMLVCASAECAKPFHRVCLDPPPEAATEKTWLCPDCDDDACTVCGGAGDLVLCDDCPRAWHLHCSVPVLDAVPEGDWTCAACRGEIDEEDCAGIVYQRMARKQPVTV